MEWPLFQMNDSQNETPLVARNWVKILAQYREPDTVRSVFELSGHFDPVSVALGPRLVAVD